MKKWNENIRTDKKLINTVLEYIGRPIPMYVIGILTTLVFDYLKDSAERPYSFIKTHTVNNITTVKLKVGNLGDQPLKFSEIISSPSILIENKLKIDIDTVYISSISRHELNNAVLIKENLDKNINIELKDEAFEKLDYLIIDIKHKGGSLSSDWNLKCRIIGHKNGINSYTNVFGKTELLKTALLILGAVVFLILFRVIMFKLYRQQIHFRLWEIIFLIMLIFIGGFYLYVFISITKFMVL